MAETSSPKRSSTPAEAATPAVKGREVPADSESKLASELAGQIAAGIAAGVAEAVRADPGQWAQVSRQQLLAWIAEDTREALAELAAGGSLEDAR
ncbi:hypothetical protein [Lentzea sp. NPDC060358]|uniref:hypothetical protein n=1 Tax=Lentzea sp. NPDC060358 TaxID=3347103 RepID=UPI003651EEA2